MRNTRFTILGALVCAGCNLFSAAPTSVVDVGGEQDHGVERDVGIADTSITDVAVAEEDMAVPTDADRGDLDGELRDTGGETSPTWVKVTTANRHTCAIDDHGRAFCWGLGSSAQLGNGGTASQTSPVQVAASTRFIDIAAGDEHTCALDEQSGLWCWGASYAIGSDNGGVELAPFRPDQEPYDSVEASHDGICATDLQDQLWCWGDNDWHQLGVTTPAIATDRVAPLGGVQVRDFDIGNEIACVLTPTGAPQCWGRDLSLAVDDTTRVFSATATDITSPATYAQISVGEQIACAVREDAGVVDCWGFGPVIDNETIGGGPTTAGAVPASVDFVRVEAGDGFACALTLDGTLYCWGSNYRARQGIGDDEGSPSATFPPAAVDTPAKFVDFSLGTGHGCGITTEGELLCWGRSDDGRLGNGELGWTATPVAVQSTETFTMVVASDYHSCGITDANEVFCWGRGTRLALGNGSLNHVSVPTIVPNLQGTFVGSMGSNVHVLGVDQKAYAWGSESYQELGNGSDGAQLLPVALDTAELFAFLTSGDDHGCGMTIGDELLCWGRGGRNGISGSTIGSPTPVSAIDFPQFVQLAAGFSHTCGVDAAGGAWCFGLNDQGQLGDDSRTNSTLPVTVSSAANFVEVTTGRAITCGLDDGGAIWCWGEGRLIGDGGTGDNLTPTLVTGQVAFKRLSDRADNHTCAISVDDEIYCWGDGDDGRLGDGSTQDNLTPTVVDLPEPALRVSAGDAHTCAVGLSGKAYCWGYREFGRLGDGIDSLVYSPAPVDVSAIAE